MDEFYDFLSVLLPFIACILLLYISLKMVGVKVVVSFFSGVFVGVALTCLVSWRDDY